MQIPIDLSFDQMCLDSDDSGVGGFLCAASGGVFCFIDERARNPSNGIVVRNPLSRKWKWLPAFSILKPYHAPYSFYYSEDSDEILLSEPYTEPYLIAMNADPRTGNFEVFFLSFILASEIFHDCHPADTMCITMCTIPPQIHGSRGVPYGQPGPITTQIVAGSTARSFTRWSAKEASLCSCTIWRSILAKNCTSNRTRLNSHAEWSPLYVTCQDSVCGKAGCFVWQSFVVVASHQVILFNVYQDEIGEKSQ